MKKLESGIYIGDNELITSQDMIGMKGINFKSPVRNTNHKYLRFLNTELFCEEAKRYLQYGYYTNAPYGTKAYDEYWNEQETRWRDGYSIGGTRITGEHYAYLNFGRIKATTTENGKERKRITFPRFLDMDYYYYHEVEAAESLGEGMIVAKSRRKGFSFKNAFGCVYKYKLFRESLSIIGAYLADYSAATMNMALEMVNFINENTDWARRKLIDTQDHIQDGYKELINGIEIRKGFKSEIMAMSFKDNPSKSIGKTADRMLFEEAGKWNKLIDAYTLSAPLFRDGEKMIGTPFIFGTGGDMEGGTQDFAEMFYKPKAYGLRAYENIYDENAIGECGWFIDEMWYREPHVDKDGNSNRQTAEISLDAERAIKKEGKSKRGYDKFITQAPKTPKEAFLRSSGNIFPSVALNEHLAYIETHEEAKHLGQNGLLTRDGKGFPKWKPDSGLIPCDFPVDNDKNDTTGCIVIWEHPIDNPPRALYLAGIDPYDQDKSTTDSLGSIIIYKRLSSFGATYHWPVAEYTGRPDRAEEFYETCRMLLEYYNALALYENEKINILTYFRQKQCDYLLADQPEIINKVVRNSKVNRGKGMHMIGPLKDEGEVKLRDWLNNEFAPGRKNLTKIYSIPLLKELIAYTDDGNFDRVMAFMMVMYLNDEFHLQHSIDKEENEVDKVKEFFSKKHFGNRRSY